MSLSIAAALAQDARLQTISDSVRLDVELLLSAALDKPRTYLYTWPERELDAVQQVRFEQLLQRRLNGEPIAYILGYQDFWTLSLEVSTDTLIPRPETELLVEQALALLPAPQARVADLGTGTGAIALALASERPDWQLLALDRVPAAVALAQRNRDRLGLSNVEVLEGDWCAPIAPHSLDMIVSNPPYIDAADPHLSQGDVRFEPASALVANKQGMADIELIAEQAKACLKPGGWLLVEHGYQQAQAVQQCFAGLGYSSVSSIADLAGHQRVTCARLP